MRCWWFSRRRDVVVVSFELFVAFTSILANIRWERIPDSTTIAHKHPHSFPSITMRNDPNEMLEFLVPNLLENMLWSYSTKLIFQPLIKFKIIQASSCILISSVANKVIHFYLFNLLLHVDKRFNKIVTEKFHEFLALLVKCVHIVNLLPSFLKERGLNAIDQMFELRKIDMITCVSN